MAHNLVGMRFGRLVVLESAGSDSRKNRLWRCLCDCGKEKVTTTGYLLSGDTGSCGCLQREVVSARMTTHGHNRGHKRERLYGVWAGMISRTTNKNATNYPYYGGRGINVCSEWRDYDVFRSWALEHGYDENAPHGKCTLDRIDVMGDYSPDNCRWVDMKVQSNNTRSNKLIEYNGEMHNMKEWAEILGINYSTFKSKISNGFSIQDMIA